MRERAGPYTASDVVQDVYEEAWGALLAGRFSGSTEADLLNWLNRRVATRVLKAFRYRLAERRDARRSISGELLDELGAPGWPPAEDPAPGRGLLLAEDVERVARAMADLSPAERQAVLLHHADGRPVAEVARLLERSISATGGLLKRAMKKLREALAEDPVD